MQLDTTLATLRDLGFDAPYLVVMNKCDLAAADAHFPQDAVCISAKYGHGFDILKRKIFEALENRFVHAQLFVPYARAAAYAALRVLLTEQEVQYAQNGTWISAVIPTEHAAKFKEFLLS